jgi:hypothetical protein
LFGVGRVCGTSDGKWASFHSCNICDVKYSWLEHGVRFIYLFAVSVGYDMSETARQGIFYFVCFLLLLSLILVCIELTVCLLC